MSGIVMKGKMWYEYLQGLLGCQSHYVARSSSGCLITWAFIVRFDKSLILNFGSDCIMSKIQTFPALTFSFSIVSYHISATWVLTSNLQFSPCKEK